MNELPLLTECSVWNEGWLVSALTLLLECQVLNGWISVAPRAS